MNAITAYYRWELNGQTGNHCNQCRHYDGQVKTKEQWDTIACPPLHGHCGCSLVFDHADTLPTPETTGETRNRPTPPPGITGEIPHANPNPIQTGPRYPPATPVTVINKPPNVPQAPATPKAPAKPAPVTGSARTGTGKKTGQL